MEVGKPKGKGKHGRVMIAKHWEEGTNKMGSPIFIHYLTSGILIPNRLYVHMNVSNIQYFDKKHIFTFSVCFHYT